MAFPKGQKIVYWDDLTKAQKADRFIDLTEGETRTARLDKDVPCEICGKKHIRKNDKFFPSNDPDHIGAESCVKAHATKPIPKPQPKLKVMENNHVQVTSPLSSSVREIETQYAASSAPRADVARALHQSRAAGAPTNDRLSALIWKLGLERMSELLQQGVNLEDYMAKL